MFDADVRKRTNWFTLTPTAITLAYVILGSIWIVAMKWLLLRYSHDMLSLAYREGIEDWLFIALTALLLRWLIKRSESQIQQSVQQYRELVEFLPVAIGLYNKGQLTYANAAGIKLLKKASLSEISGTSLFDVLMTDNAQATQQRLDEIEQGRPVPFVERQLKLADGSTIVAEVAGIPFMYAGERAVLLVAHDITMRKQLEAERLQMYEALEQRVRERTYELERRRRVAEGFSSIIAKLNSSLSLDEILGYVAEQTEQVLGVTAGAIFRLDTLAGSLTAQRVVSLTPADVTWIQLPFEYTPIGKAIRDRQTITQTCPLDAEQDGGPCWSLLATPLILKDAVYGGLVLYFPGAHEFSAYDIKIATVFADQVALAIENASLLAEVEETSALAERNRLAHDLHDSVSQVLFSASLIAEVLPAIWTIDQTEGLKRLHELRQLTRGAMAEMRTLLHELRPAALEEAPLPELLRQLVEATMGRASIPIDLVIEGLINLPAQKRIALYRITQQALDNIFHHAKASQAVVRLCAQPACVELQIEDDGCGFDPAVALPGHLGLNIMRERAEAIGATFDVQSQPGHGSRVTVCV